MLLIDELYHLSKVQNMDIVKIIDDFNLRGTTSNLFKGVNDPKRIE